METPEEFLKHYHNNLPNDWLFEKREVVARLIKEYTEQALRIHDVGRSEQLLAFKKWEAEKCKLPWDASPEQIIKQYLSQ
jgi:hypothetical protein